MQSKTLFRRFLPSLILIFFASVIRFLFKDKIIRIKKADTVSGELELKDWIGMSAKKFKVKAGDIVTWKIRTKKVLEITAIYPKDGSLTVFSVPPHNISGSSDWKGTVSDYANGQEEEYAIKWIDKVTNQTNTYDPKIQVQ